MFEAFKTQVESTLQQWANGGKEDLTGIILVMFLRQIKGSVSLMQTGKYPVDIQNPDFTKLEDEYEFVGMYDTTSIPILRRKDGNDDLI